ncbi:MAG: riboflavin biosynthesis protein RibF [Chloroflexi bacterium RBG_19FT_COMBO_55_16]|nr:MAG: riboflavin biosynthesis protein RibF [Chloroflexi bacterium RBG_19FT_COMBO_55_16]
MRHFLSLEGLQLKDTWLTIGTFDGVHRGHQEIVRKLAAGAHSTESQAAVLTFFPHPALVLGKRRDPFYLTTPDERAVLLGKLGADIVITFPFNLQTASTSAYDFMALLKQHLGLHHLIVGYDFALGKDRQGDVPTLQKIGVELGYTVEAMPPFKIEGEAVSSSRIRSALAAGDMELAALLLGRPFQVSGKVVTGDGRGRTIGIPTANLSLWAERAIPRAGVYVCQAVVNGKVWGAVTNVGFRPTFESQPVPPRVETHLLDFITEIYGQEISLNFLSRLRDEQRFPNVEALAAQIQRDIAQARQFLEKIEFGSD